MPAAPKVGQVDSNGILWKATATPGTFSEPLEGHQNLYSAVAASAAKNLNKPAAGVREILETETDAKGFEKLTLAPTYTWTKYQEYITVVDNFGRGLEISIPTLSPGDTLVIYADTQMKWMQAAFGSWRQGLIVGTIYATLGEEGALYGINQSKSKAVVADGKLLKILAKIATGITACKDVIALSKPDDADKAKLEAAGMKVHLFDEICAAGANSTGVPKISGIDETAVLMYTSGTTGNPKGVLLSHRAVLTVMGGTLSKTGAATFNGKPFINPDTIYIAYLPLAHIMEMAVEITFFSLGVSVGYGSTGTITPTAPKMKQTTPPQKGDAEALSPTVFVAAPAVLDRVYKAVLGKFEGLSNLLKGQATKGLEAGKLRFENDQYGTVGLCSGAPLAKIVFKKVQKLLGGNIQIMLTGSAPLAKDVQIFMQTVFNCPVRQGYGLTETCAATTITCAEDNTPSAVGPPQESACIKLRDWPEGNYLNADEKKEGVMMRRGEVLIGGPTIASGYFVDKDAPDPDVVAKNKEEFVTIDGINYFCTGDIGQFTPSGNLQIIDRKKDLVKLQQGEYVALSKVENVLKGNKYTALPMVHAVSSMYYCIALICPVEPKLMELAASLGVTGDFAAVCADKKVADAVLADVTATCKAAKLAKFEIPTKVILISELWTPDNDMLTAVQKLKRKEIVGKHKAEIDTVYV